MKKLLQLALIIFSGTILQIACTKNKYEKPVDPVTSTCDTNSTPMSYSINIKPIMVNNCGTNGCHDATNKFGGWDLSACTPTAGNGVQMCANTNNQLLGAITHSTNVNMPMPPQGKLLDCEIAKIRNWIQQGAKDN